MVGKLARPVEVEETVTVHSEGLGERMLERVREAFCGLHGHDNLLQFGHDRMYLKCASCGHESPGWELNEPQPAKRSAERAHPALVRGDDLGTRRIA
jgi:hypothetical protein